MAYLEADAEKIQLDALGTTANAVNWTIEAIAEHRGAPSSHDWRELKVFAVGQQAAEHGLCPQGELRSTVELRARGLGAALL